MTKRLFSASHTADKPAGQLSADWAERLGLRSGIPVAVGLFDCHAGAIGAQVAPGVLVKVFGTSTCDITVAAPQHIGSRSIAGICGQVDGSVVPGAIGLEAGQSAFGDLYGWFRKLVNGPTLAVLNDSPLLSEHQKRAFAAELEQRTLHHLDRAASQLHPSAEAIVALDWINGRRTPNANQRLTLALQGVTLGTDTPALYRALIEATAFGARAIIECFEQQGVAIDKIVGIGGIAKKSALVMQICADVFNKQIDIIDSEQSCARGAALCAAVAAGLYPSVHQAQQALAPSLAATYKPRAQMREHYDALYQAYTRLGSQEERRHEH